MHHAAQGFNYAETMVQTQKMLKKWARPLPTPIGSDVLEEWLPQHTPVVGDLLICPLERAQWGATLDKLPSLSYQ